MTVQELIDELEKIEDKSEQVCSHFFCLECGGWWPPIKSIYEDKFYGEQMVVLDYDD